MDDFRYLGFEALVVVPQTPTIYIGESHALVAGCFEATFGHRLDFGSLGRTTIVGVLEIVRLQVAHGSRAVQLRGTIIIINVVSFDEQSYAYIFEGYFRSPVAATDIIVGGCSRAVRGKRIVDLETLLRFVDADFVLGPDFRTRRRSPLTAQWLHLFYQIRHDLSVLQIIVTFGTVARFDVVRVVQTIQRVRGNVNSSANLYK